LDGTTAGSSVADLSDYREIIATGSAALAAARASAEDLALLTERPRCMSGTRQRPCSA
jgi:DNA-binding FadR family transcriptional regulator